MITGCSAKKEHISDNVSEDPEMSSSQTEMISSSSSVSEEGNVTFSAESTTAVVSSYPINSQTNDTSKNEETSSAISTSIISSPVAEPTSSVSVEEPAPSVPVVEEPTWTEETVSGDMYVSKENIYSREKAIVGSAAVRKYNLNDKVSVLAVTDTGYYKLEDGSFIHKDYLSNKETVVTPSAPSTPVTSVSPDAEKLLNSAKLNPMKTNCEELDVWVAEILGKITTADMSTYQKVTAIYDYIIKTYTYGSPEMSYNSDLNYHMMFDHIIVSQAYTFLENKKGMCDLYAALFMVMTRAIGLESYIASGQVSSRNGGTTGHTWTIVKLEGEYYIFDTQVEQANLVNGQIYYKFFCKHESVMSGMYTYGPSYLMMRSASYYPDNEDFTLSNVANKRDCGIVLFGNFVTDEGEAPYADVNIIYGIIVTQ